MQTPRDFDASLRWIQPSGHLGDALLLSALLKAGFEASGERFGLVRLQPYTSLFIGHPAIAQIATPRSPSQPVLRTDHWAAPAAGATPYARLSQMIFGRLVGADRPWAEIGDADRAALRGLPFTKAPLLLAPAPHPAGDGWPAERWAELVARLAEVTRAPIAFAALGRQPRIAGALNLSGLLQPRQLLALVERVQGVIGVDPFLGMGARMVGTRALSLYELAGVAPDLRGPGWKETVAGEGTPRLSVLSVDAVFGRVRETLLPALDAERPLVA